MNNLHKPLLLSSLNNSHILQLTGAGFNLASMKTKVLRFVEVIQDDYLNYCSPGSYGLKPCRMQLNRPIHH